MYRIPYKLCHTQGVISSAHSRRLVCGFQRPRSQSTPATQSVLRDGTAFSHRKTSMFSPPASEIAAKKGRDGRRHAFRYGGVGFYTTPSVNLSSAAKSSILGPSNASILYFTPACTLSFIQNLQISPHRRDGEEYYARPVCV